MKLMKQGTKTVLILAGIVFFFAYLFQGTDVIPDTMPWFGFLDDAIAAILILLLINWTIKKFKLGKK